MALVAVVAGVAVLGERQAWNQPAGAAVIVAGGGAGPDPRPGQSQRSNGSSMASPARNAGSSSGSRPG
jgi:hypothetical protein